MLDIYSGQLFWLPIPQAHIQTRAHILLGRRVRRPLSHTCRAQRAVKPRALIKQLRFLTYLSRTHPAEACIRWDSSTCSCRKCSCTCACRAAASGHTRLGLQRTRWEQKDDKTSTPLRTTENVSLCWRMKGKVNQATVTSHKRKRLFAQCLHFNAGYTRAVKSLLSKVTRSLITMEGCVNFWDLNNLTCVISVYRGQLGGFSSPTHTWLIIPRKSSVHTIYLTSTSSKHLGLQY